MMSKAWRRWHKSNWAARWSVKSLFVLGVVALMLFPDPRLLAVWSGRIQDCNALLDPAHPALQPLQESAQELVARGALPREAVERVVLERVPYAWDWDIWGAVDYWPTVAEVFQKGREDCDGRAVVAASLLRRMGIDARLVSDFLHVWVETPQGDLMGPTGAEKSLVGGSEGTETRFSLGLVKNLSRGFAFGVAVFPLSREAIMLCAIVSATLHPFGSRRKAIAGALLMAAALWLLRSVGESAAGMESIGPVLLTGTALACAALGWWLLASKAGAAPGDSPAAPRV